MIEVLLALWVTLVGVGLLVPVSRSLAPWGMALAAPLLGTAAYVLSGLVLATADVFSTIGALSLATVGTGTGVVIWYVVRRERPPARSVLGAAVGGGLLAVTVAALTQSFHWTRLSTDSFHYLMSATALERTGSLEDIIPRFLLKRQLATPLLHTAGSWTDKGYVAFWMPLLGVSAVATMMWIAFRSFSRLLVPWRWRIAIGVAALAVVLTTNRVVFHLFYINGHMLFAGLLLVAVGFAWYAGYGDRWHLVVPAAAAFAALVPLRAESVMVVAIFLVPVVTAAVTPQWASWVLVLPTVGATVLWDVVALPPHLPDAELALTGSVYGNVWVVVALVGLVALRHLARFRSLVRYAPWVVFAAVVGFVAVRAWRDFPLLFDSVTGLASGLAATGRWSAFWWVVPMLFVGALLSAVVPFERFYTFGIGTFAVALFAFAYLRGSAYGSHPGDSANRMVMHLVFVTVLYLMIAAGEAARRAFPEPGVTGPSESVASESA